MSEQIEIEYKGDTLKGILITEDEDFIQLKLDSGYNANLKKSEINIISQKKIKESTKKLVSISKDNSKPTIVILHTGGTIASKVDYKTGGVISRFTPEELINLYPELNSRVNIEAKMIHNMWSGDMNFNHYNLMMEEIELALKEKPIGIILSHGTDTIHYTTAALQYSLENLPVPVLLVAAQRSADRPSSDGFLNLKAAIEFFIYNDKKKEKYLRVGLSMHSSSSDGEGVILDGINLRKMHSSRRDSFHQINYHPLATVSNEAEIKVLREDLLTEVPKEKFSYTKYNPKLKIGMLKSHPNLFSDEISRFEAYDAVVIEGSGLGHLPVDEIDEFTKQNTENLNALVALSEKTKLIMGTQCIFGGVNMNVYSYGRVIQKETPTLGNHMNLTPETLFIRTAYLLSKDKKNFEELWSQELEGFSLKSEDSKFL